MKTKFYWKVIRKTDKPGIFTSYIVTEGKYCLTYQIGKITKARIPETGILVFETRQQARDFKSWERNVGKIFKVIPTGKRIHNPMYYDCWKLEREIKQKNTFDRFPCGTVAFDSVKVIGR